MKVHRTGNSVLKTGLVLPHFLRLLFHAPCILCYMCADANSVYQRGIHVKKNNKLEYPPTQQRSSVNKPAFSLNLIDK